MEKSLKPKKNVRIRGNPIGKRQLQSPDFSREDANDILCEALCIRKLQLHQNAEHITIMGWLSDIFGFDDGKPSKEDPLRRLDPTLRDYLARESPVKYSSTNPPSTVQAPTQAAKEQAAASQRAQLHTDESPKKRPLPTLFPDGRYADLWKSYRPLDELEAEAKSDQEKVNDILEGYNQRKAQIGRAALENCALEQWDVNECFTSGGWQARMTMCRAENRKFERCYVMQSVCIRCTISFTVYRF